MCINRNIYANNAITCTVKSRDIVQKKDFCNPRVITKACVFFLGAKFTFFPLTTKIYCSRVPCYIFILKASYIH